MTATLAQVAAFVDEKLADVNSRIEAGRGEWPKPGYVRDDDWADLKGQAFALRQVRAAIDADVPATHFVRVTDELVEQLKAEPSQPVTIQIEEREGGELSFVATRATLAIRRDGDGT